MRIFTNSLLFLTLLLTMSLPLYSQYKWTVFSADQNFVSLEDTIDKGNVVYHKTAQNNLTLTGKKGLLLNNVKFLTFPTLSGTFSLSQAQISSGKLSFYPHLYVSSNGAATFAFAVLYNVGLVDPVQGIRTRPSISPESIASLEKDAMSFNKLKFVADGFTTEVTLQPTIQESAVLLDDYEVTFRYWLKASPPDKEVTDLYSFFDRSMSSFQMRAYSDKGYLDVAITGKKVEEVKTLFLRTLDLNKRLNDALPKPAPTPAPKAPAAKRAPVKRQAPATKVTTTNSRPKTTRVVRPS